jgi:predicted secreted protein with PEFG-CTERM motif
LGISVKGYALIAILVTAAGAGPAFAFCPPDCAPKVNYQAGSNGTFAVGNYTGGGMVKNMTSTTPPIVVTTDKSSYNDGDKIMVSGSVTNYLGNTPVSIIIRNPIGNVVYISQLGVINSTTYSATITAGGALWQAAGNYTITAQYGGQDRSATTSFNFSGSKGGPQNTFPVDGTNFTLPYTITNGKVLDIKADVQAKSLIVSVQTTGDGTLTITMPRALIDAKKTDGSDDKFFVLNNDQENDGFDETSTTTTDRTLSIPFTVGTEKIEIIGTMAVPEFGSITVLVLAIAIITIIAISVRTRLGLMPRY